jgi:hypothetical protein
MSANPRRSVQVGEALYKNVCHLLSCLTMRPNARVKRRRSRPP